MHHEENKATTSRRRFLKHSLIAGATLPVVSAVNRNALGSSKSATVDRTLNQDDETREKPARPSDQSNRGKIFKSVKWGMIRHEGSVLDKFKLQKELGYDGIELVSPGNLDAKEVRAASDATGMPVHGLVNTKHWQDQFRLSSPDPARREAGREILMQCLRDAKAFGGDSVLLVPGRVSGVKETHDHVWQRSIEEIRKTLPLASQLGVRILIENVWNGFCETPAQLCAYLDEIDSPWVGAYYDIGNAQKFQTSHEWIAALGTRIVKLDVKDWGETNGFCKIGDGDVVWEKVCQVLNDIGFTGWCTAEVGGGPRKRLADIAARMDRCLNL